MGDELNPKRVAMSLASVAGIVYIVCAILVALAPTLTVKTFGALFHGIDISQIATTPTIASSIIGFIEIVVLALIVGWLFAVIYNKIK